MTDEEIIAAFEPSYRSMRDDLLGYQTMLTNMVREGKLERERGGRLYLQTEAARRAIQDRYIARGLLEKVEAHYLQDELLGYHLAPLCREAMQQFVERRAPERAIRLWRQHITLVLRPFWTKIAERAKPLRIPKGREADRAMLQSVRDETIASIPDEKARILSILSEAAAEFAVFGTERDRAWLAGRTAEVEAEERRLVSARPDRREMDEELFWALIEQDTESSPPGERIDLLAERLTAFSPKAIATFQSILSAKYEAAYRSDVWALAYLLQEGCSDDAFDGFRQWLILQGRAVYEATLAAPDDFDVASCAGRLEVNTLFEAAESAYEVRTGKLLRRPRDARKDLPDLEEERFPAMLPKVAARTSR